LPGALKALGTTHALVVHGEPGMDEISPLGPTHVVEIRDGLMTEWTIEPSRFGMSDGRAEELAGGGTSGQRVGRAGRRCQVTRAQRHGRRCSSTPPLPCSSQRAG
jgi:anthranilate phosphoribosyltransferase